MKEQLPEVDEFGGYAKARKATERSEMTSVSQEQEGTIHKEEENFLKEKEEKTDFNVFRQQMQRSLSLKFLEDGISSGALENLSSYKVNFGQFAQLETPRQRPCLMLAPTPKMADLVSNISDFMQSFIANRPLEQICGNE